MITYEYSDLKLDLIGDPNRLAISLNIDDMYCHINDIDVLYLLDLSILIDYIGDDYDYCGATVVVIYREHN